MIQLQGKKVTVLGLGRSGIAASELLLSRGAKVFGSDSGNPVIPKGLFDHELGEHTNRIFDADIIIVSPGIPSDSPVLREARRRKIRILGEIELAYQCFSGKLIAVTGTNGKTTTCAIIKEMLSNGGFNALLGGNISPGVPLSRVVLKSSKDAIIVAEVSTFQLETIELFKPFVGILTNISPDHLDRHKNLATYVSLKRKLFINQQKDDFCILNFDEQLTKETEAEVNSNVYFFSAKQKMEKGTFLSHGKVFYANGNSPELLFTRDDVRLPGMHNLENVLAASTASILSGCDYESLKQTVSRFSGVPHRLEFVRELNGISFVNNSMCTNPVAFKRSVETMTSPFVLICGGRNKNLQLEKIVTSILKAKFTVIIGESSLKLAAYLRENGYEQFELAGAMEDAVEIAYKKASRGDTVLLSPGASSFDMFRDFVDRGNCFKQSVKRLNND